jgi:transcriptional regulatory protein RtcR
MPNLTGKNASITRLATLGENARISAALVAAEIARLRWQWAGHGPQAGATAIALHTLMGEQADTLDYFDKLQLQAVLAECRQHSAISDAGRALFNISRTQRSTVNDADRLRKYLMKFGLTWDAVLR